MKVEKSTTAATIAGAATVLVTYALKQWGGTPIPPEIATAITTVIMALLTQFVPDSTAAVPPPANMKPAE